MANKKKKLTIVGHPSRIPPTPSIPWFCDKEAQSKILHTDGWDMCHCKGLNNMDFTEVKKKIPFSSRQLQDTGIQRRPKVVQLSRLHPQQQQKTLTGP